MNVLLLDDDVCILTLLRNAFVRWGYEVAVYTDAAQCPVYCSQTCPCNLVNQCPDLILTDVRMPSVDGVKFVEELRRKGCKCPKIGMMSGDWGEKELQKAAYLGTTVFFKPFHIPSLRLWVEQNQKRIA